MGRKHKADAAVEARRADNNRRGMTGSFRIEEEEMAAMDPAPLHKAIPVPGNTLVVANVFGFHRRGDAVPGNAKAVASMAITDPSLLFPSAASYREALARAP